MPGCTIRGKLIETVSPRRCTINHYDTCIIRRITSKLLYCCVIPVGLLTYRSAKGYRKMVKVALVGIGGYGASLLKSIRNAQSLGACQLIAAADSKSDELPEAGELSAQGIRIFSSAEGMFSEMRGQAQAMIIGTGIPSHEHLTVCAAKAGYHVHIEKPPAATIQEVDRMLEALRTAGRFCQVGFQAVHGEDVRLVKKRIVEGRLGKVSTLKCGAAWPRNDTYYGRNGWAGKLRIGENWVLDGPATNALCHQISNMLLLASDKPGEMARPAKVRAELYTTGNIEAHSTAAIEIITTEGVKAYFIASHTCNDHFGPEILIDAQHASAVYKYVEGSTLKFADGTTENAPRSLDASNNMMLNFIEAIEKDDKSLLRCPLEQTRQIVLALNGAHESSGSIIVIDDEHVKKVKDAQGTRLVVTGIDDVITQCAEQGKLPSDLDKPPAWAKPTKPFSLEDYFSFPQRFCMS